MTNAQHTMITREALMQIVVSRPQLIADVSLSKAQVQLFNIVKIYSTGMTSCMLSLELDISIHSASTRLAVLCKKGYLRRENVGSQSGGDEYVYFAKVFA